MIGDGDTVKGRCLGAANELFDGLRSVRGNRMKMKVGVSVSHGEILAEGADGCLYDVFHQLCNGEGLKPLGTELKPPTRTCQSSC